MSEEAPRVSAIIIVLDGEQYLEEAIRSVLCQQFEDWELLVVDDGSSDGTLGIARHFAAGDRRIHVIRHDDLGTHGMSATRNLGLGRATGEYIGFLDSDDVWVPEKLAEQVAALESHPDAAMVYGRTLIWHSAGEETDFFYSLGVPANHLYRPPRLFLQLLENVHQSPTTCNALIRREAAIGVGGFDDSFPSMFEDQVFFARLLAIHPAYVSDRVWAKYRQHPGSASARADQREVWTEQARYLRAIRSFLVDRGKTVSVERLGIERKLASLQFSRRRALIRASLRHFARA